MSNTTGEIKPIKLHLGCGEQYLEGYVNIDYPASEHSVMTVKADKYADIRTLSYPENTVDEIRTHHMFEHFPRAEAIKLLMRWRSWLKPGGKIVIETPDFAGCARAYTFTFRRKRKFELGRHAFGSQEAGWAIHYDFWDAPKFRYVLGNAGFAKIRTRRYSNRLAQKFPQIPLLNIVGALLPDSFYRKHGGHKLPNILVTAVKTALPINEKAVARKILSTYLVGREGEPMLQTWMKQFDN